MLPLLAPAKKPKPTLQVIYTWDASNVPPQKHSQCRHVLRGALNRNKKNPCIRLLLDVTVNSPGPFSRIPSKTAFPRFSPYTVRRRFRFPGDNRPRETTGRQYVPGRINPLCYLPAYQQEVFYFRLSVFIVAPANFRRPILRRTRSSIRTRVYTGWPFYYVRHCNQNGIRSSLFIQLFRHTKSYCTFALSRPRSVTSESRVTTSFRPTYEISNDTRWLVRELFTRPRTLIFNTVHTYITNLDIYYRTW